MYLFTLIVAARLALLESVECNPTGSSLSSGDTILTDDILTADSPTAPNKLLIKRQFSPEGFNDKPRPNFPNRFQGNFGSDSANNFGNNRRPNFPNGFDNDRRTDSVNSFDDSPRPGSRPDRNQNRPATGNNVADDDFFWGAGASSTTGSDRITRRRTTPRSTTPPPSRQSSNGRPIENDCTRRCFNVSAGFNPVCGTDNVTYPNPTRLQCAQDCGIDVRVSYYSQCRPDPNRVFPNRD